MGQRTMLKLTTSENCIFMRTVSRGSRSPHRFVILEEELKLLEEKRHVIVSDILSYAQLQLWKSATEENTDNLVIKFTWLSDAGGGKVSGTEETLQFPYAQFREKIEKSRRMDGGCQKMLSTYGKNVATIKFQSRKNLRAVAERKVLRKKLGKFLNDHFAWKDSRQITVYDDFEPYSFFFREETPYGAGICGGIILHGRDDLKKAYYGIHT